LKKRLIFIESSDIGVRYSGRAARALGFEPLFLCDLRHYQADPRAQLSEFEVIDCPTANVDHVGRELDRIGDIAAITSFADIRMRIATEVAARLGVTSLDPKVRELKDKSTVQRLVPEFSPATIDFTLDNIPLAEIKDLFRQAPSLIVKPVDSAGALGLMHLYSMDEIERLHEQPVLRELPRELISGRWIAQSFVTGDLISVEGFVSNSRARILGVSRRKKVGATESGSTFPADHTLNAVERERAINGVLTLIERSRFRRGYFHIEFIVNGRDCTMIDANIGRIGGGAVAEQIALAYGHDPAEIFKHVLLTSLFPERLNEGAPLFTRPLKELEETYAILYGLEKGGRLRQVRLPETMSTFHTQVLGSNALVSPMGRDDWSWIGIICGRTADSLRVAAEIEIITDEGSFRPYY
jgi:hypothetical protein